YNQVMNILQEFETIAAISTPLGTGGVGVIRISGEKSFEIALKISDRKTLPAGKICHGWIMDGEIKIDEVVILPFKNPNSYTGEDVVEIQCHGGVNVVRNILDIVLKNGARIAERGEFTKRAFLNKKLDLSQAEAVDDLIHAKTSNFAIQSAKNLSGVLAAKINEIKGYIFETTSRIVAGIDFPEDVVEPEYSYLIERFSTSLKEIDTILASAKSSDILRQGIKVAIVGRPNVGKSSLFNALLNLDRAIVTDIAGTTRDIIKENLDLGVAVTLIDTAGIREDENIDKVEEIGIEYSKQSAQEADLILFLYDANTGLTDEDKEIYEIIKDKKHIVVANKIDLVESFTEEIPNTARLSTYSKDGLEDLKEKMKTFVCEFSPEDTEYITNKRQQECLRRSREALQRALLAAKAEELQDMIYIDLKSALLALDEITGEVITDDILNNIFDHFCIGK
ncbi:MAG: tRNA uridine-5-carboxymethylaminomethyl(34) synthesis GTPase MnmE, partial [Candidatus Gastranaerophilales bacterium]|nr:tRNA uridine-5-carboxymethylaminomethyl(34) synthesis GTPase MnmE [Candidatus Gastranaerophilales bacterium]